MKPAYHFFKGIENVLMPSRSPFRFPNPITPYIQPHFMVVLKHLKEAYGTEITRQKKVQKSDSVKTG